MKPAPVQLTDAEYAQKLLFPYAEQPDIIRASQKDDYYRHVLNSNTFDVLRQAAGPRAMKFKEELQLLSDGIYYGLSTLLGCQTLGEEYCDIMQVKEERLTSPRTTERILLLIWHILVPYGYTKLQQWLTNLSQARLQSEEGRWVLQEHNRLEKHLPTIIAFIDIMKRVHIAIFYFSGVHFDFSKRMAGIRYIFNRKIDEQRPQYTILGLLIFIQLGISLLIFLKQTLSSVTQAPATPTMTGTNIPDSSELWSDSSKCSLCLDPLKYPTATTCGHLFCWECITGWCNNKAECPLCRTPQKKNQLMVVYGI